MLGWKKRLGSVRAAKVISAPYTDESGLSAPMIDVMDGYGGIYKQVRWIAPAGSGGIDSFSYRAPAGGAPSSDPLDAHASQADEVLLGFTDGARPFPFILGSLFNVRTASVYLTDTDTNTGDDADPSEQINAASDHLISQHKGGRILITGDGTIVLDTRASNQNLKIGLNTSRFVQVGGEPFDERLLLGKKFEAYLIAQVIAKIDAMGAVLAAAAASPDPANTLTASGYTYTSITPPGPELLSSLFHISEDSE